MISYKLVKCKRNDQSKKRTCSSLTALDDSAAQLVNTSYTWCKIIQARSWLFYDDAARDG